MKTGKQTEMYKGLIVHTREPFGLVKVSI